jgi:hypothetical protein
MVAGFVAIGAASVQAVPLAESDGENAGQCSVNTIKGEWVYLVELQFVGVGNGNALGTMNFDSDGSFSGVIDVNIPFGVLPDGTCEGQVTVEPDCTGELDFACTGGGSRIDSIVISGNGKEIWGMSMSPVVMATWKAKRISGRN